MSWLRVILSYIPVMHKLKDQHCLCLRLMCSDAGHILVIKTSKIHVCCFKFTYLFNNCWQWENFFHLLNQLPKEDTKILWRLIFTGWLQTFWPGLTSKSKGGIILTASWRLMFPWRYKKPTSTITAKSCAWTVWLE